MTTSEDIAASVLSLSDAELFQADFDPLIEERETQLLEEDFLGVAVTAPRSVSLSEREELPVVAAFRTTGLRAFEVGRDRNTVLFAIDLDARLVRFAAMFWSAKELEYPPDEAYAPGRPTGVSATSVGALVRRVDARARLDLPWNNSRQRIGVLQYDVCSNLVDVALEAGTDAPRITRGVRPLPPEPPSDGASAPPSIPTYLPFGATPTRSPAAPATIVFGVVPDPARGVDLLLWGSFGTRADPAHLLDAPPSVVEIGGAAVLVAAVVPITIALVALDSGVVARLEIGVPVYGPARAAPGEEIVGYFTLDLRAELGGDLAPGEYRAYAFVEGCLSSAVPFTVR